MGLIAAVGTAVTAVAASVGGSVEFRVYATPAEADADTRTPSPGMKQVSQELPAADGEGAEA